MGVDADDRAIRIAPVSYAQVDGAVVIRARTGNVGADLELTVNPDNVLTLLTVALTALRVGADSAKLEIASKICLSNLGTWLRRES